MDRVILLNKPAGITSFDAVRKCRQIFHEKKAGHTGTLDPQASGLLIVLLGKYTKLVPFAVKDRKSYHATFSFGALTDTQDVFGTIMDQKQSIAHDNEEISRACEKLRGDIMQVPPMYSAIKVNGKKLYEYARKGEEIERVPRPVTVYSLEVNQIGNNLFEMNACVSSGTYIRTLIYDFGMLLGEYAAMSSLVRTGIESLSLEEAVDFDGLEQGMGVVDPAKVIDPQWRKWQTEQVAAAKNGRALLLEDAPEKVMLVNGNSLLAAYERRADGLHHCVRGLY